jgi:hypothetical protein
MKDKACAYGYIGPRASFAVDSKSLAFFCGEIKMTESSIFGDDLLSGGEQIAAYIHPHEYAKEPEKTLRKTYHEIAKEVDGLHSR